MEWPSGEATACKAVHTGSIPVSTSESDFPARLAQRESASLTRKRSLVQSQYRAPQDYRRSDMVFSLQSEIRAQNLPNDPRGRIDRGRCDPLLRRQLQHPAVLVIGNVHVAGGVDCHILSIVEAGDGSTVAPLTLAPTPPPDC